MVADRPGRSYLDIMRAENEWNALPAEEKAARTAERIWQAADDDAKAWRFVPPVLAAAGFLGMAWTLGGWVAAASAGATVAALAVSLYASIVQDRARDLERRAMKLRHIAGSRTEDA